MYFEPLSEAMGKREENIRFRRYFEGRPSSYPYSSYEPQYLRGEGLAPFEGRSSIQRRLTSPPKAKAAPRKSPAKNQGGRKSPRKSPARRSPRKSPARRSPRKSPTRR